jgi:hypothetical protein
MMGNDVLKIYKNKLLEVINHSRFSPSDFSGREAEENGQGFFEICYRDSPLKFRVLSSADSYELLNYQFVGMAPGFPWWGPFGSNHLSKTCDGFADWLENHLSSYVEEQSASDHWSQLQPLAVLFEGKWKQQEELESFTENEKVEIRRAIRQLERQIAEGFTLTSAQADIVHSRFDYLEAAVDRLNRFDWFGLFLAVFISIMANLSLDTERGKQLYELVREMFSGMLRLLE